MYGNWKRICCRWRNKRIWEKILEALVDDTDVERLIIDVSHVKVHLAADAHGMLVRFFIASGIATDCSITAQLVDGFQADYLPADRVYDINTILLKSVDEKMLFFVLKDSAVLQHAM